MKQDYQLIAPGYVPHLLKMTGLNSFRIQKEFGLSPVSIKDVIAGARPISQYQTPVLAKVLDVEEEEIWEKYDAFSQSPHPEMSIGDILEHPLLGSCEILSISEETCNIKHLETGRSYKRVDPRVFITGVEMFGTPARKPEEDNDTAAKLKPKAKPKVKADLKVKAPSEEPAPLNSKEMLDISAPVSSEPNFEFEAPKAEIKPDIAALEASILDVLAPALTPEEDVSVPEPGDLEAEVSVDMKGEADLQPVLQNDETSDREDDSSKGRGDLTPTLQNEVEYESGQTDLVSVEIDVPDTDAFRAVLSEIVESSGKSKTAISVEMGAHQSFLSGIIARGRKMPADRFLSFSKVVDIPVEEILQRIFSHEEAQPREEASRVESAGSSVNQEAPSEAISLSEDQNLAPAESDLSDEQNLPEISQEDQDFIPQEDQSSIPQEEPEDDLKKTLLQISGILPKGRSFEQMISDIEDIKKHLSGIQSVLSRYTS